MAPGTFPAPLRPVPGAWHGPGAHWGVGAGNAGAGSRAPFFGGRWTFSAILPACFEKSPAPLIKKARGGGGIRHPTIGITRMNLLSQQSGVRPSSRRLTTGRPTTAASSVQIAADGVASHWRGIRGWVGYGIRTRHRISPSPPAKS